MSTRFTETIFQVFLHLLICGISFIESFRLEKTPKTIYLNTLRYFYEFISL